MDDLLDIAAYGELESEYRWRPGPPSRNTPERWLEHFKSIDAHAEAYLKRMET